MSDDFWEQQRREIEQHTKELEDEYERQEQENANILIGAAIIMGGQKSFDTSTSTSSSSGGYGYPGGHSHTRRSEPMDWGLFLKLTAYPAFAATVAFILAAALMDHSGATSVALGASILTGAYEGYVNSKSDDGIIGKTLEGAVAGAVVGYGSLICIEALFMFSGIPLKYWPTAICSQAFPTANETEAAPKASRSFYSVPYNNPSFSPA